RRANARDRSRRDKRTPAPALVTRRAGARRGTESGGPHEMEPPPRGRRARESGITLAPRVGTLGPRAAPGAVRPVRWVGRPGGAGVGVGWLGRGWERGC